MEQSALLNAVVMAAVFGFFRNVIASPDPREVQRKAVQGAAPASLRSRGGIPKGPLASIAFTASLEGNPTERPAIRPASESKLDSKMFLKAPSNWFLPSLKKWPNLQADLRQSQMPSSYGNYNDDIFLDATKISQGDEHRSVSRSAPAPNNLRYSARTLADEWHPRYTPLREHQRLLKILG